MNESKKEGKGKKEQLKKKKDVGIESTHSPQKSRGLLGGFCMGGDKILYEKE